MNLGNTSLRWVMALIGAALALGAAFFVSISLYFVLAGPTERTLASGSGIVAFGFSTMCSLIAWVWAGSSIAPGRHRRVAIGIFSAPVVLLAVSAVIAVATSEQRPNRIAFGFGAWLACVGIILIAVRAQLAASTAARRKTVEQVAAVFSDGPDQKQKVQG
jgi:hypothetical protein